MRCAQLRCREIINVCSGHRLGYVGDVEIDLATGSLLAFIVPGRLRLFGLLGREEDYVIPFDCVSRIGEDIILVEIKGEYRREKSPRRAFL